MKQSQAVALWAVVKAAYPTAPLVEELWLMKLQALDAIPAERAIDAMIDEEKFPTWAAVMERMPHEQEPYNFGNQGGGGRSALPPMSDGERERAEVAKKAAFDRWHEFKRTHAAKPDTAGAAIEGAIEELGSDG